MSKMLSFSRHLYTQKEKMQGVFTNVLWYIEFFAFAATLIAFFMFFLYLADLHYMSYNIKFDMRKKIKNAPGPKVKTRIQEPNQRPVCCDLGCIWFCRLVCSIVTIAVCYYFAYELIKDTKLKFGIFVP
ncbi:uncharacterized protein LOC115443614 [Manduca sexta]|uniref:uncharacterized protein LOC115443614 n=1 Tax=Manduca sexta TaxID=7130 RepID=UPI0011825472|nr:uncharacterized protein LOC115443614 [Manduca sexta]